MFQKRLSRISPITDAILHIQSKQDKGGFQIKYINNYIGKIIT